MVDQLKVDPFWYYDNAVTEWVRSYDFVNAVFGDNDLYLKRVHVRYRQLSKEFSAEQPVQMQVHEQVILPRIALTRLGIDHDYMRSIGKGKIRKWNLKEDGSYDSIQSPKAYNLTYQIDIETRTEAHMLNIMSLIYFDIHPGHTITVDVGRGFGKVYSHMTLLGNNDNSLLDLDKNQDTLFRRTLDIKVEAWLYMGAVQQIRPVRIINVEFYESTHVPAVLLDTVTVGG